MFPIIPWLVIITGCLLAVTVHLLWGRGRPARPWEIRPGYDRWDKQKNFCSSCLYWVQMNEKRPANVRHRRIKSWGTQDAGWCKRYPPTGEPDVPWQVEDGYPITDMMDGCGEYRHHIH